MSRPHQLCTEKSLGIREEQTSLREAQAKEQRGEEKPRPAGIDDQTGAVWLLEHVLNLSALLGHDEWSALFRMRQSIPQDVFLFLKGMTIPHRPTSRSSSRTGLLGVVWFSLLLFFVPQGPVSQIRLVEAGRVFIRR